MALSAYSLLRLAGLVVCLVSGARILTTLWFVAEGGKGFAEFLPGKLVIGLFGPFKKDMLRCVFDSWLLICAASIGLFAWTFHWITGAGHRPSRIVAAALVAQTVLGILVNADFLVLTSIELPFIFSIRNGVIWLAIQEALFFGISLARLASMASATTVESGTQNVHFSWLAVMSMQTVSLLVAAAWHGFAFCCGYLATSEQRARERLASANAELRATQQLLAEGARSAERLRIARDLHDAMGHHLMVLNLHLEIAKRAVAGKGQEALAVARGEAQRLTEEVRKAVGMARQDEPIDLRRALETLCTGIPAPPPVKLFYGDEVCISDVSRASLIFRCVQEGISNAVRHAAAREIAVHVAATREGTEVIVRDDGSGGAGLEPGNGLNGMRERVTLQGGRLDIVTSRGQGMALRIWLPAEGDRQ